ncbi:hypothetical protein CN952_14875 [Bacillus cereus]|uniref:glycosyltransferase n=1 Tax=Bacillus cereus TaxID=1396 RepID=UPI000BFB126E|nr:glycosyltransferase [Bacillus cereus]PGM72177.1 hypothetical protein CN952_14875 [Bacillus cereus]PGN14712.1 hypothetical protein CN954_04785 [Bacillus cereus]
MNCSKEKCKIVYIIGSLRPGGAERHLVELIKAMDKERFLPIVYCMSEKGLLAKELEDIGVVVKSFDLKNNGQSKLTYIRDIIKLLFKFIRNLREDAPIIVHTYLYWANILGGIATRCANIKFLITSRRSLGLFKDRKKFMQKVENIVNIFTDVITVNSQGVQRDTEKREKFIKDKVILIYNGVDHKRFTKKTQCGLSKSDLGINENQIVITNISNLIHYKGHMDFIEAMSLVIEEKPDAVAVLVGRDGGMLNQIINKAKELGIEKNIKILGTRNDIVDILNITDIQVLSSYEEGFSNAILEGMASSLPLVVTDVGGNSEAVCDGINGFVIPPKNSRILSEKLLEIIKDENKRIDMGIESRKFIEEKFTIDKMLQEYQGMYISLLKKL